MNMPTMKTILSCILILSWICGNEVSGKYVYDVLKLKPLMDGFDTNLLEDVQGLPDNMTCNGKNFSRCYGLLLDLYNDEIQDKVVDTIDAHTVKLLNDYNELVMSAFEATDWSYKNDSEPPIPRESADKMLRNAIRFETSNVYCVISFLKMFDINLNDKLADYIFYSLKENIQGTKVDELKKTIRFYIENRTDRPTSSRKYETKLTLLYHQIPDAKESIIKFSNQFCNIGIPQKNVDSWMWKKLKNSHLLSQKVHNSTSLMDWQDLKVFKIHTYINVIKCL